MWVAFYWLVISCLEEFLTSCPYHYVCRISYWQPSSETANPNAYLDILSTITSCFPPVHISTPALPLLSIYIQSFSIYVIIPTLSQNQHPHVIPPFKLSILSVLFYIWNKVCILTSTMVSAHQACIDKEAMAKAPPLCMSSKANLTKPPKAPKRSPLLNLFQPNLLLQLRWNRLCCRPYLWRCP